MNMKLISLQIKCRKKTIEFPFDNSVTYIYGKMGAGKTTIIKLINFCFGEDLVDTPALQQEFLGATVNLRVEEKIVILTRNKEDKNKIYVEWYNEANPESDNGYVISPVKGEKGNNIIPDTDIENISDLLFYLMGYNPPKVRRNKVSENIELIRLSFKNIMSFWNLDQDKIDNSFFYLDEKSGFQKNSSRDVMRLILGFNYEQVALLENDLSIIQSDKRGIEESIIKLDEFFKENDIQDLETIENKLFKLEKEREVLDYERKEAIKGISNKNVHVVDELKHKIRLYVNNISQLEEEIEDLTNQIRARIQLKEEYFYASIKLKNINEAKKILQDAEFVTCPQCGSIIDEKIDSKKICSLCKQPLVNNDKYSREIEVDLIDRRKEIEISINKMSCQKNNLILELQKLKQCKGELDQRLNDELKEYDSLYLSNIRKYDTKIDEILCEIKYLTKIKELPKKIEALKSSAYKLEKNEEDKKEEIKKAKDKLNKQTNKLDDLKTLFIDMLNGVKFPGINKNDYVLMNTRDFFPRIVSKDNDIYETTFTNLSSGGKKTIFKCCFAFAIQLLNIDQPIPFPNILIIDTPMKNISERENIEFYQSFYRYIYKLMANELKDMQLVIIDKEFYQPEDELGISIYSKHMTPDDPNNPGLIDYYSGH